MAAPPDGVWILAVEEYRAGLIGTRHPADFGAEVIEIENRRPGGDYARALGPCIAEGSLSSSPSTEIDTARR